MNMRPETVFITGVSSGIGLEIAHVFARDGYNVVGLAQHDDQLCDAMRGVEHEYGVRAWCITQDLTAKNAVAKIDTFLRKEKIHIDVMVNNAGFGVFGEFIHTNWEDERELLELNIVALTELTKYFGQIMVKRGRGKILNVASVASFFSRCLYGHLLCLEGICIKLFFGTRRGVAPQGCAGFGVMSRANTL